MDLGCLTRTEIDGGKREILAFFAGLARKIGDEAATLEESEHLRRVA